MKRLSAYRVMWVLVFFDLPTTSKKERKSATTFRNKLLDDGFVMFQFSIYMRHCASIESADVHVKRVKGFLPKWGEVGIIKITDKQFGSMELYRGKKFSETPKKNIQLELF